jgi:predicted nucleic acid-binding protein
LIETSDLLRTTEVVVMEVLAGTGNEREYSDTSRLLARFELLPVEGLGDFLEAVALYRACRRGGETIRKMNDCLIAAVAIRTGAQVLHQDRDFEALARHSALRIYP